MKKQIVLFSLVLVFLFSIVSIQAITFNPTSVNLDLTCGEAGIKPVTLSGVPANCTVSLSAVNRNLDGLYIAFPKHKMIEGDGDVLYISYGVDKSICEIGQETINIDVCGTNYPINVNVAKKGFEIFDEKLYEGEKIMIGSDIELILSDLSEDGVKYRLLGCGDDKNRESLDVNESETYECNEESLIVNLERVGSSYVIFDISSSLNFLTEVIESDEADYDSGECVLGFSTGGFLVKRGQSLIGTTINAKTGEYRPNVIVKIVDPMAEIPMITLQSDQFGSVQQPLSEDYKGLSLALSLSMPIDSSIECTASTNNKVDFDKTYTDYLKDKEEEEGKYQLVLNFTADRYEMKVISNTVKNGLGEVTEGATVRITKPDNSFVDLTTNSLGVFSFTPNQVGIHKLQSSKNEYTPSVMCEIEVYQNKQYLIIIKTDGKSMEYKSGDRISFELRDENNTLIPLTIDSTFGGIPLRFISGISDPIIFSATSILVIPAIEGYLTQSLTLTAKETDFSRVSWIVGIIIGLIIMIILVGAIRKKMKGSKPKQQMEIQLGEEGG